MLISNLRKLCDVGKNMLNIHIVNATKQTEKTKNSGVTDAMTVRAVIHDMAWSAMVWNCWAMLPSIVPTPS